MALTLTNLIATPTFEQGSVGGWVASAGTMVVTEEISAYNTKALKVTATAANQVIEITAPSLPIGNVKQPSYMALFLARGTGSSSVFIGNHYFNSAGTKLGEVMQSKSVNTTFARQVASGVYASTNIQATTASLKPAIRWTATNVGDVLYIDAITFLRADEWDYLNHPWSLSTAMPDVFGWRAPWGNVTFAWTGAVEASTSIGTSSAVVSMPSPAVRGEVSTITGSGFTAGSSVGLRISNDSDGEGRTRTPFVTVTTDSTGAFTHNWTNNAEQGSRWVAAQITTGLGWGAVSSEVTIRPQPADPADKNYIVNPYMRAGNGTARYVFNGCTNPSPTLDLTGWDPAGAATVTRTTDAQIKGPSHGARVVSSAATDGISLPWHADWTDSGHTAYVRAVTACTLKITAVGDAGAPNAFTDTVGWGDDGWGGTGFVYGDTVTLAAGQVIRARLSADKGTGGTASFKIRMKITGSGTYDVDGVWQGMGVADGYIDAPGSVPFFCGGTAADADFTYEWIGTPYASVSARRGTRALGIDSGEGTAPDPAWDIGMGIEEYDQGHLTTLAGGETAVALRGPQWFYDGVPTITNAAGGATVADLGLTVGKSYMFSADVIMDYATMVSGYAADGSNGNAMYLSAGTYEAQPNLPIPGRTRTHIAFNVDAATEKMTIWGYWGWLLGEVKVTKLSLTETKIYSIGSPSWTSPADLTASGLQPGTTVLVDLLSYGPVTDATIAFEALLGGGWTVINSVVIPTTDWEKSSQFLATVPAGATGMRLTTTANSADGNTCSYAVSDAPPDYWDGSSATADGWAYSWEGATDASPSVREATPAVTARVFVGGIGIPVSEMRVAIAGGTLIPITEAG